MDRHVTRRILHGLGANAYVQLVIIIIQLAGVPILLHAWGTQLYGEWLILAAIPTYLSMTDLGFSQSAGNDMTARMARGDVAGALAVFQSLSAMVYGLALAGLVLVALLMAWLPLGSWLHFAGLSTREVRWILWLLAAEVLVRLCDGVNHAGFRSHGDYARHVALNASTMLLQNVAAWAAALSGAGLVGAALALVAVRAIEVPVSAAWLLRRHHDVRLGLAHASARELRRLAKPALANLSMPLAMALSIQGMVLVVGAVLGPLAVVVFSTLRTLTRIALQMVWRVANSFEPELAAAWGSGDRVLLRRLYLNAQRGGFWLALLAALVLWWAGPWFLGLWTHGRVIMNPLLFTWLLVSAVASMLWYGALNLLKAGNVHLRAAVVYVFAAAAAVMLAFVLLLTSHRLADAGLALMLADAVMAAYLSRRASRVLAMAMPAMLAAMVDPRPLKQGFDRMLQHVMAH